MIHFPTIAIIIAPDGRFGGIATNIVARHFWAEYNQPPERRFVEQAVRPEAELLQAVLSGASYEEICRYKQRLRRIEERLRLVHGDGLAIGRVEDENVRGLF